jgi:hypothetical protein
VLSDLVGQKKEERADRRAPHGGNRREKRYHDWKAQTRREGDFLTNTARHFRPAKLNGGGGGLQGRWASTAKLGRIQGEDLNRI